MIPHRSAIRSIFGLVLCILGAKLFLLMDTVLPWMIGPMVTMALASMFALPVARPPLALPVGQLIVGCALGLFFTDAVLLQVWELMPYLVAASLFAFVLGGVSAALLKKLSGCDASTAFFASLPGGAAEMSNLAAVLGGRNDWVAAAHALRVVMVVLAVPPLLTLSGVHGHVVGIYSITETQYPGLACIVFLSIGGGWLFQHLKVPNAWMIGPLLITTLVTGFGYETSAMPRWGSNAAQLLIGCALGSRFDKAFLRSGPKFITAVGMTVALSIVLAGVFGWFISSVSDIDFPTAILATAPGGVAEMSVTAKFLQLGVPIVTVFHVMRMAFLVLSAKKLFFIYKKIDSFISFK